MGVYLNRGNIKFEEALNSEIYVDKTDLISYTNRMLHTTQKYICVSRPRRFGKSMAADMLNAYYSCGCDSKELFQNLKIAESEKYLTYINQFNVVSLNMQEFLSRSTSMDEMLFRVRTLVMRDIKKEYPEVDYFDDTDLLESMRDVYEETKRPFIIIIDEWDCIFREYREHKEEYHK